MAHPPRRRSRVSFRALYAAVAREAAFKILWPDVSPSDLRWQRLRFSQLAARYVRYQAARHLQRYPGRRHTP